MTLEPRDEQTWRELLAPYKKASWRSALAQLRPELVFAPNGETYRSAAAGSSPASKW